MARTDGSSLAEKKKLYVGCALTGAPETFTDAVEATKEELSKDWAIMQFLGTTAGTEIDVYEKDIIENVSGCDAFLGVLDETAFGLGFETRDALEKNKRVLLVANSASRVTRLALALPHFFPEQLSLRRYEDMVQDVPEMAREEFADILSA